MRALLVIAGYRPERSRPDFLLDRTQTFIRSHERLLAVALTLETGALLALSIALIFSPSVQRAQSLLLLATLASLAIVIGVVLWSK